MKRSVPYNSNLFFFPHLHLQQKNTDITSVALPSFADIYSRGEKTSWCPFHPTAPLVLPCTGTQNRPAQNRPLADPCGEKCFRLAVKAGDGHWWGEEASIWALWGGRGARKKYKDLCLIFVFIIKTSKNCTFCSSCLSCTWHLAAVRKCHSWCFGGQWRSRCVFSCGSCGKVLTPQAGSKMQMCKNGRGGILYPLGSKIRVVPQHSPKAPGPLENNHFQGKAHWVSQGHGPNGLPGVANGQAPHSTKHPLPRQSVQQCSPGYQLLLCLPVLFA